MDMQNRVGSKGTAGLASQSDLNLLRKNRLKQLQVEMADVSNDPYIMRNHLGSYECRLCLTLHTTESSYLAHTTGKKHQ
jgi:splicing factor 3A subunit 2